ncbi:Tmem81 [Columba guinea]|nr:Tmem81 [Columba guinea]
MTMKTLGNGHILGTLLGVFYLPSVVCYDWVTIPAALASAPARLAINSTSCSVTCGLGFKQEESCEVTPAGERKDCVMRTSRCLTRWFCGLLHFTIPVGKPFQLTCQPSDTADFDRQAYGYVWKFAQGLITTENVLFKRLQENDTVLRLLFYRVLFLQGDFNRHSNQLGNVGGTVLQQHKVPLEDVLSLRMG